MTPRYNWNKVFCEMESEALAGAPGPLEVLGNDFSGEGRAFDEFDAAVAQLLAEERGL